MQWYLNQNESGQTDFIPGMQGNLSLEKPFDSVYHFLSVSQRYSILVNKDFENYERERNVIPIQVRGKRSKCA